MKKLECDVYKSSTRQYLYLFVASNEGLSKVPHDLLTKFGEPKKALSLTLTRRSVLAKSDPVKVLNNLLTHGYHLQLPPTDESFV